MKPTSLVPLGAQNNDYLTATTPDGAFRSARRIGVSAAFLLCPMMLWTPSVQALPSFARQTDMPCSQCHTIGFGPQLTAYGRQFKLNGYVWGESKTVLPPVALMMLGGFSRTERDQAVAPAPHFSTNDNLSADQFSVFYGGRISEHVGALVQATYSGIDRHTTWDNLDVRFARTATVGGMGLVYGVSINNSPTVQDLWNSTPAWGFPFISSALVPKPSASPMIAGGLSQRVLGTTAYAMLNDHYYVEAGAYRGLSDRWLGNVGFTAADSSHLDGLAPYWRAAWQVDKGHNYYSVGTFGLNTKLHPNPSSPETDAFKDLGVDATYQFSDGGKNAVTANLSVTHEKQDLHASFAAGNSQSDSNYLTASEIDVTYGYRQTYVIGTGWFKTQGGSDSALYAPAPISGSNGSPNSRGYILQLEYVPFGKANSFARPWLNMRFGIQYTGYQQFNGGNKNYDGFGRSASDNNTLFVFAWLAI
jgi:hypothetical protein